MGMPLSLHRRGPSCSFLFPLNLAHRMWLPVSLGQGTRRGAPSRCRFALSSPHLGPSCCLSSKWDQDPCWLIFQACLPPTLPVASP